MLGNALIGLREGLEAALVVSILLAYLTRTGQQRHRLALWAGIGAAVALSFAAGGVLTLTAIELPERAEPLFAGLTSIVAVALVTWMIFWMRQAARSLSGQLRGRLDAAFVAGTGAVAATGFVAVAREGLETAMFLWSAGRSAGSGLQPLIGAALGIAVAVGLAWAMYRQALHLDLAKFFRWTSLGLIVVAAGVLAYAVHDLQEGGLLPGSERYLFDLSDRIPESSAVAQVVHGVLNLSPAMTVLQVLAWTGYLGATLVAYLRPARTDVTVR